MRLYSLRAHSEAGELSGWYLSYVHDPIRDGSDLIIIDASDFQGKPVARVQLPRRVPYGFHGNWIADRERTKRDAQGRGGPALTYLRRTGARRISRKPRST